MLSLPEKLVTDRLLLQRLRYEDAEEIFYAYASKKEATRYVTWPTHRSVDDTRRYLSFAVPAWRSGREQSYTVRLPGTNRLVGSIGVVKMNSYLQFGYILSPTQWNQGYATEVCKVILHELRTRGHEMISTFVDVENNASIRVLEKSGLRRDGVFPKWFHFPNQGNEARDCILYSVPTAARDET